MNTTTTWTELIYGLGRNDYPDVLYDAFSAGRFASLDELARGIEMAWTACEFPMHYLDADQWQELFGEVGFLDGSRRTKSPRNTLRLYRAATPDYIEGMSWTDSLESAKWFHNRNGTFGFESAIYTATVEPFAILAHFADSRHESEWVIAPGLVDVETVLA